MNSATMTRYRKRLSELRQQLEHDVSSSVNALTQAAQPPGTLSHLPTHPADSDSEGLDAEVAIQHTLRNRLDDVNEALAQVESGEYGKCMRCGKSIAAARLNAIPEAPLCITCESEVEAERG